jgi:hypothetical protein
MGTGSNQLLLQDEPVACGTVQHSEPVPNRTEKQLSELVHYWNVHFPNSVPWRDIEVIIIPR